MKTLESSIAKSILAGLIAGAGVIAAAAYAMPGSGPVDKPRYEARQDQMHSRWQEQRTSRLADLKAKLKLAPAQEAAWSKFAEATQPPQRPLGVDSQAMREEFQKLNTVERMDRMLALSEVRRTRMTERVEALKAFYSQLSPEQQKVFDTEIAAHRQERMHQRRFRS